MKAGAQAGAKAGVKAARLQDCKSGGSSFESFERFESFEGFESFERFETFEGKVAADASAGKGDGDVGNYILFPSSLYELSIRTKGRVCRP